jgi:hypothetical protein
MRIGESFTRFVMPPAVSPIANYCTFVGELFSAVEDGDDFEAAPQVSLQDAYKKMHI